jgi:hypothetical protein
VIVTVEYFICSVEHADDINILVLVSKIYRLGGMSCRTVSKKSASGLEPMPLFWYFVCVYMLV